ncbi:MAG: RNA polymerase sigma factor [Planctomycetes bacterium]|nr:RNA polymerase sigma factor [Planctomycetota bacterium]
MFPQESLVAVFQHIEKFERRPHHGGFRAWLWTILFRKAADLRRRDAKQMTLGDAVDALAVETDCCEDSPPEPEPEERNDFLGAVLRTVRVRCTERSWNAFLLTAMNGLTSVDAGERLGMTAEAVRRAKSRVLAMIRAELGILEGHELVLEQLRVTPFR